MSFPLLAVKSFATLYAKNRIKETTFKMGGSLVSSFCILEQNLKKNQFPYVLCIHAVKFSNEQRIDEIFEKLKKHFLKTRLELRYR